MASTIGVNKVFILDKYFSELNKFVQSEFQAREKQLKNEQEIQNNYHNSLQQQQQQNNLQTPLEQNLSPLFNYSITNLQNSFSNKFNNRIRHNALLDINDLIHLDGPITEASLISAIHSRFTENERFTNIGPVLICINTFNDTSNSLNLNSAHQQASNSGPLLKVVNEAVRQQSETGYPQAIILGGNCGSGKTYASMIILRQLFNLVGGGPETDSFKHLAAAFTVLRSLGSAKTVQNVESSRVGNFIEVQVTDGAIYRTKIHCYFLDQTRVVSTQKNERNYHIFYQMLAGLSSSEKTKLYLDGYEVQDFHYLNGGDLNLNTEQDAHRFQAWKSCLSVLGIPFMDVVRVLAAILLLGNVQFDLESQRIEENVEFEIDTKSNRRRKELQAVANLLGISSAALHKALTIRTIQASNGNLFGAKRAPDNSLKVRDSLAKALFVRTVATIVRRANSSKRLGSSCGTVSSESNESLHQGQMDNISQVAPSSIISGCGKSYKTMAVLNNAVRYAMDGFIGILDMFGFEDGRPSQLEQLCINLCAETMQHFYNTHIFKSSIESCRDEGIKPEIEINYVDNVPCIDFISSLRTGLFSLLDQESRSRNTNRSQNNRETLVEKIRAQHSGCARYFEANIRDKETSENDNRKWFFGVRHFVEDVVYDTRKFTDTNSDYLCDDLVSAFHKTRCSFGFVSHLFGAELRCLNTKGAAGNARGVKFRIAPTAHLDPNAFEPKSTLTQDFHSRLDNLLRTLVHARPHFVRCIKINDTAQQGYFDQTCLMKQIRAFQVLETVNLMARGLPHRMRFKAFVSRYRILVRSKELCRTEESLLNDSQRILQHFDRIRAAMNYQSFASTAWILGRKHIFLSESARQQLELVRNDRRISAAISIQSTWRGTRTRRRWPEMRDNLYREKLKTQTLDLNLNVLDSLSQTVSGFVPTFARSSRPQPIAGTPPPNLEQPMLEMFDLNILLNAAPLLGIDLNIKPEMPPPRRYTVSGQNKYYFPQERTATMDYLDPITNIHIPKGEKVTVLGGTGNGQYVIEYKDCRLDVSLHCFRLEQQSEFVSNIALCI